jgi:hypothetical protein
MNAKLLVSVIATAATLSINASAAEVVTSSSVDTVAKSYGRAGGMTDADRVSGLQVGTGRVGVSYDADVAARTNMQRSSSSNATVGVTYDADVAARTNMQRATEAPAKAAGVTGPTTN